MIAGTGPGSASGTSARWSGTPSRSFLTVEAYLAVPTDGIEIESPADYVRAVRPIASGPEVADRGRAAGEALGGDPVAAVVEIADRVLGLVDTCDGTEPVMTAAGGMRLADYLPDPDVRARGAHR